MHRTRRSAVFLVGLLLALLAPAAALASEPSGPLAQARQEAGASEYAKLRSAPVRVAALSSANATQFLAADRKGRVFLLRGDTLEVFRLGTDASFDAVGKLACHRPAESAYAAAMDPTGSTWAVSGAPFELALCDFAKQQEPSGLVGWVSSLAFSPGGRALVAVIPIGSAGMTMPPGIEPVPRVLRLEDGRWKPISWAPLPQINDRSIGVLTQIKAQYDSLVCGGTKDSIWLASWNAYRLQQASDSEKPRHEIVLGTGKVEWKERTKQEQQTLAAEVKKAGRDVRGIQPRPQGVMRALVCGRDGLVYMVVTTKEGLALDRFDPSQKVLERVLLDGVKDSGGPMTAALSPEGMIVAGRLAAEGLWRISSEDLAAAQWRPVHGVQVDGIVKP